MIMFNNWIDVNEQVPPFDELVLLRGYEHVEGKEIVHVNGREEIKDVICDVPVYALAFNECYPPRINMTQVVECESGAPFTQQYPPIVFKITHWMRIPE